MKKYQSHLLVIVSVGITSCATMSVPGELVAFEELLSNSEEAQRVEEAAPELYAESIRYHGLARLAIEDSEQEQAVLYSMLATTVFETGTEKAKAADATARIKQAKMSLSAAKKAHAAYDNKNAKESKHVARMEKIVDLEQKVKTGTIEAQVTLLISEVKTKIQTATDLKLKKSARKQLATAQKALQSAQQMLAQKKIGMATQKILAADKAATKALSAAITQMQEGGKLIERQKLYKAASAVSGVKVKREDRGIVLIVRKLFVRRKTELKEGSAQVLSQIRDLCHKYPEHQVVVEGHTDSQGRAGDNLALSTSRAQAVVEQLIQGASEGEDISRIRPVGVGEEKPMADNTNRRGRNKNRRIEVIFLFPDSQ
jgi:outer membrane protein OmpA-like peptidoglycan-associated protein